MRSIGFCLLGLLLPGTGQAEVTVSDDQGRPVTLERPAQRVVALSPHLADLLRAAGGADLAIGVSQGTTGFAAIPRVAASRTLSRESILRGRPELVLSWGSGNPEAWRTWLRRQGVAVYVSEPGNLKDIARTIIDIGALTGRLKPARRAAERFLTTLRRICPTPARAPRPAFLQLWPRPLMTIGGDHWLNDVLAHAGLRNAFGDEAVGAFVVSREAVERRTVSVWLFDPRQGAARLGKTGRTGGARRVEIDSGQLFRPDTGIIRPLRRLCAAMSQSNRPNESAKNTTVERK